MVLNPWSHSTVLGLFIEEDIMAFDSDSDNGNFRMKNAKQKPIHEVRLGHVKAAVWRNETEAGVRYNVN
jgi:hypothetical protein